MLFSSCPYLECSHTKSFAYLLHVYVVLIKIQLSVYVQYSYSSNLTISLYAQIYVVPTIAVTFCRYNLASILKLFLRLVNPLGAKPFSTLRKFRNWAKVGFRVIYRKFYLPHYTYYTCLTTITLESSHVPLNINVNFVVIATKF